MADITLPQLGETVSEGTITQWFKQVGDAVEADEPLFEVSTDKVDTEVPSPVSGVLVSILAAEGETVDVGAVVAVVDSGDTSSTVSGAVAASSESQPGSVSAAAGMSPSGLSSIVLPSSTRPAAGQGAPTPPVEVAPPAAPTPPVEVAPPAAPTPPVEVAVPASEPVDVRAGSPMQDVRPIVDTRGGADGSGSQSVGGIPDVSADSRLRTPLVRKMIREHGLDPVDVYGTGLAGRVTRNDVFATLDAMPAGRGWPEVRQVKAAPPVVELPSESTAVVARDDVVAVPMDDLGRRDRFAMVSKARRAAGRFEAACQMEVPQRSATITVDCAALQRAGFDKPTAAVVRAVVDAIGVFPLVNATFNGSDLVVRGAVNLGVLVETADGGMVIPVVADADGKRLGAITGDIDRLRRSAQAGTLSPADVMSATFTLSDHHDGFMASVVPTVLMPQVAAMSVGAVERMPVVISGEHGDEAVVVHPVMTLTLSWDVRVFGSDYASGFLATVKDIIERRNWSLGS